MASRLLDCPKRARVLGYLLSAVLSAVLFCLLGLALCSCSSARETALKGMRTTLEASLQLANTYDVEHKRVLARQLAGDTDRLQQAFDAYVAARDLFWQALIDAHLAVAAAHDVSNVNSLAKAAAAIERARDLFSALRNGEGR